jgi:hypothetical protein
MIPCILAQTDCFTKTVTIRPIASLPNHFEMVIQSQLATAKNPSELHVLHKGIVSDVALLALRDEINEVLTWAARQKSSMPDKHSFWSGK